MSKILVPLATGFEELEAVTIIDVLRRGGLNVFIGSVDGKPEVLGAHNIGVRVDVAVSELNSDEIDMIVLPGGWDGTRALANDPNIQRLLQELDAQNKSIGAICAAPFALEQAGVLKKEFTCYPSVEEEIKTGGYHPDQKVVRSANVTTSRGPGTAICFALEIVKDRVGEEKYKELKAGLLADFC